MTDAMDYFEELQAEIDRLKVLNDIFRRELKVAREVAKEAYSYMTYTLQSHLFDASKPFDMSVFAPEAYEMMPRADQCLFDKLKAYSDMLKG